MIFFILVLVFCGLMVYISRFNFMPVSVNLGFVMLENIPLFYVIIGCIIFSLIVSYLFFLFKDIAISLALKSKDNEIKKQKDEILELTKTIHQLELDNEKIKNGSVEPPTDPLAL